jgi:hypothetical protein
MELDRRRSAKAERILVLRVKSWFSPYILGVSEQFKNLDFCTTRNSAAAIIKIGIDNEFP